MMIYWTPLDLDQVFDGWDKNQTGLVDLEVEGVLLQVQPLGNGEGRIVRLISANPMDYLQEAYTPGRTIAMV